MQFPPIVEFCSQSFLQQPGLVIPAVPQSSHFAAQQQFVHYLRTLKYSSVLDLGAGSGMLGISLWQQGVQLTMTDLNPHAVALAEENSRRLAVPSVCLQGSWFEPVTGQYDLVIVNPPHGTTAEWHQYEWAHAWVPKISVDGGLDGLDSLRTIFSQAAPYVNHYLCAVYARSQHALVLDLAQSHGFHCAEVIDHQDTCMGIYLQ